MMSQNVLDALFFEILIKYLMSLCCCCNHDDYFAMMKIMICVCNDTSFYCICIVVFVVGDNSEAYSTRFVFCFVLTS